MNIHKLFFDPDRSAPATAREVDKIPTSKFKDESEPAFYQADPELATAVNVALLAGKPLLLTGEPGIGKTQLAYRLAWEFGLELYKLEVKSTTKSTDLFYYFDMIGYFRSAQTGDKLPAKNFIEYNALGKAIMETKDLTDDELSVYFTDDHELKGPRRAVVLIDEIDKAPRDFPNDILNELEHLYFKIPEINNKKIEANPSFAPIVILTSNSEKNLPDPFLRRCIFHHIKFPEEKAKEKIWLTTILKNRIDNYEENSELANQLLTIFQNIRKVKEFNKLPSTSELILWTRTAAELMSVKYKQQYQQPAPDDILQFLWGLLFKTNDDLKLVKELFSKGKLNRSISTLD